MEAKKLGTALAILAAALYALNAPFSKELLAHTGPTMMAAFLYLGQASACCSTDWPARLWAITPFAHL